MTPNALMSRAAIVTLALLGFAAAVVAPASGQTILFEGARVILGDGSPAIDNAAILVERGTISRVGRKGDVTAPVGATRVDLDGKTVMPAIVSAHVHPGFQKGLTFSAENFTRENIVDDLNRELYFGVSTVMSQGIEKGDIMYEIRADQAAGRAGGARLLLAGRGMGAPNAGPGAPAFANIAYEITTPDQARSAAQELAAKHVDAIKIWVDDRGGRAPSLPIALSRAVIDEGHRLGLKVTAHVFYHADALELAAAGVNSFAHLVRDKEMSDDLIALMLKNHVYAMPNIGAPERAIHTAVPAWFEEPYLAGLLRDTEPAAVIERVRNSFSGRDPATADRNRRNYVILQHSLAKLSAAGVPIILGCDTGLEDHFFGYAEQKELELMVEAGMTPAQVIVAATSRPAEFLGLADRGRSCRASAPTCWCSTPIRSTISATPAVSRRCISPARRVDRAALKASLTKSAAN